MSIVLPLLYILLISLSLTVFLNKRFNDVVIFSFLIPVFLIYTLGLVGSLKLGFYLSLILCFIWIIPFLIKIKDKKFIINIIDNYFTLGFFVFIGLFIGVSFFLRYASFFQWDDFTHWGPMVKEMYRLDKLYCVNESLLPVHRDYPPMVSILELLWCHLCSGYEERFVYRAIGTFSISLIIPFIPEDKEKNRIKRIILTLLVIAVFIASFFVDYMAAEGYGLLSNLITIYPDALVGLFSAFVFVYIYKEKNFNRVNCLFISLLLTFMLMIKQISFAFFLMIIFYSAFKLYRSDLDFKDKIIKYILYFLTIPLIFYFSWNIYSNLSNIDGQFALSKISLSQLINIVFFNKGLDYQLTTKSYFLSSLINRPMLRLFGLTYFELFLIFVCVIIFVLAFLIKDNKLNVSFITFTLTIGVLGFAFTMFTLYMFTYSEYEALKLASFERYMQTYIVFMMYVAIFTFVLGIYKINMNKGLVLCLALALVMPFSFKGNMKYVKIRSSYEGYRTRYEYKEFVKQIGSFIQSGDKILAVSQIKDDYIELISRYEHLDVDIDFISLGIPNEEETYRLNKTYSEWKELYQNYDYIYTYHTDELFYREYWLNKETEYLLNNRFYLVKADGSLELVPWIPSEE